MMFARGAIGRMIDDLAAGDRVAWIVVGVFILIATGLGLFVLKTHLQLKREDAEMARKQGRRR